VLEQVRASAVRSSTRLASADGYRRNPGVLKLQVPDTVKYSVSPVEVHPAGRALPALNHASGYAAHVQSGMTDRQLKVTYKLCPVGWSCHNAAAQGRRTCHHLASDSIRAQPETLERRLQDTLAPWDATRVLHWRNFEPGVFGGYESQADNAAFDRAYFQLTYYQGW